jgi:hypothetical protein
MAFQAMRTEKHTNWKPVRRFSKSNLGQANEIEAKLTRAAALP